MNLAPWIRAKKMRILYRCILAMAWMFLRVFYKVRVYGMDNFFPGKGILAANHTSFYDPPLIATSWPEEVHFLARRTLFRSFFGRIIGKLNAHPVNEKGSAKAGIQWMLTTLQAKQKIIVFPEGQRSYCDDFGEVKGGVAMLALKANAPIIPVYIDGAYAIWNRFKKKPKLSGKIAVVFGAPIQPKAFAHLKGKEAQEAVSKAVLQSWTEMRRWLKANQKNADCKS